MPIERTKVIFSFECLWQCPVKVLINCTIFVSHYKVKILVSKHWSMSFTCIHEHSHICVYEDFCDALAFCCILMCGFFVNLSWLFFSLELHLCSLFPEESKLHYKLYFTYGDKIILNALAGFIYITRGLLAYLCYCLIYDALAFFATCTFPLKARLQRSSRINILLFILH